MTIFIRSKMGSRFFRVLGDVVILRLRATVQVTPQRDGCHIANHCPGLKVVEHGGNTRNMLHLITTQVSRKPWPPVPRRNYLVFSLTEAQMVRRLSSARANRQSVLEHLQSRLAVDRPETSPGCVAINHHAKSERRNRPDVIERTMLHAMARCTGERALPRLQYDLDATQEQSERHGSPGDETA